MRRQVWVFLDEQDVDRLVRELATDGPLRVLRGRFCRGSAADGTLETAEAAPGERRVHLVHPAAAPVLVTHPVPRGPFSGWTSLDEARSEVVTIVRPEARPEGLAPGRVSAATHYRVAGVKVAKSPAFVRWAAHVLGTVERLCPPTERAWLRLAEGARRQVVEGATLTYLGRRIAPEPPARLQPRTGPGAGAPPKPAPADGAA